MFSGASNYLQVHLASI